MFGTNPVRVGAAGRPVFGRAARVEGATVGGDRLRGKALLRRFREARVAAEFCPQLPAYGEHEHVLMLGFFPLAAVIADIGRRVKPRALRIATLCWSKRNVADLAGLTGERASAGDPLPVVIVVSDFFRTHNKELVEYTREQMEPHGPLKIVPARSHAKVAAFDLGPGDGLVIEGSANLRTNRNTEQATVIRDRATHDHHAGWIDRLAEGKK